MNEDQTQFEALKISVTLGSKKDMPADNGTQGGSQNNGGNNGGSQNGGQGGVQNIPFLPNN